MITLDRIYLNEASDLLAVNDSSSVTTSDTICIGRAEYEHLKEQLALSREDIERLKYELKAEKGKTDRLKDYYESVISGYRRSAEDARIVIKELETAIADRMKHLADK